MRSKANNQVAAKRRVAEETSDFETHPVRGRFNALFFRLMDVYVNWHLRRHKEGVYADLPNTVVEIGSGIGANFRYLRPGTKVIAVEPNSYMHHSLCRAAQRHEIELEIRDVVGERIDLPDSSVDAVISSLVLCTVTDPCQVVSEVRRVLRSGGRYSYLEHVAAAEGTMTRRIQRAVRRPWAWVFEGCSCERDLQTVIQSAGFSSVENRSYRIHSPFVPFNTHIVGIAEA
ncbi:MAG TPA: methyltransferase domain-containing protein [Acidimicrobiales bacterium]|jgi:ubiquinone/menaquinone biosynthesis C-methylase UbiE|nr:methyltransferase domain-containing protein [Acidimicrobiales bacterium]